MCCLSLSKKIQGILENNPKCEYNAKAIYDITYGVNDKPFNRKFQAKIRTELNRLADRKSIRRCKRGFYKAIPRPEVIRLVEDPEVTLHGIKLECHIAKNNILRIDGISADNNILMFFNANRFEKVNNKFGTFLRRWTKNIWWEERDITITIHEEGLVEVFCGASNNPLNFIEFGLMCEFLNGFLSPISPFTKREVMLVQIGTGRDFWEQELDGVTSITLHKFVNDWARIYQKKDGRVRYEHHLKLRVTLEDAFNSMGLLTSVSSYESNGKKLSDEDERLVYG